MAEALDITKVRLNTNEPDDSNGFTDEVIGSEVDELGVSGASASIWRQKAAKLAELARVTEAGATHDFQDLHKNALAMAKDFERIYISESVVVASGPVIKPIVRET